LAALTDGVEQAQGQLIQDVLAKGMPNDLHVAPLLRRFERRGPNVRDFNNSRSGVSKQPKSRPGFGSI